MTGGGKMTRKERIEATLEFKQPDRPPHFEQLFEISLETFGMDFPAGEEFEKATGKNRKMLFEQTALLYAKIIEEFNWDAVAVCPPVVPAPYDDPDHYAYKFILFLKDYLKTYFKEEIPVGAFIWGSLICIDTIKDYVEFTVDLFENREKLHNWAETMCTDSLKHAKQLIDAGVDFIDIASDHAFNKGTFLSPGDFADLVTPYMKGLTSFIQSQGKWVIMHTDGDIMGILDQILDIKPDVLQSIDPMAGMDIKEIKKQTYGKIALMGNVQCSYVQSGPPEKIIESSKYCLEHGSPGGGYIFSSSNTIFKGVPLKNYRIMLDCLMKG